MILGGAEYYCLLHSACSLEIGRYFLCDLLCAVLKDNVVVKVLVGIDAVLDQVAVFVLLSTGWAPAVSYAGLDVYNAERGQEAVLNSGFQAVGVDRLSEIVDI